MAENYKGANEKVLIRCNKCGYEWRTVPRSVAASKCGCPKCGVTESKHNQSIQRFLNNYDKDKYEFVEFKDPLHVTVKCKKCGYIRTTSSSNIYKYGCPKCGDKLSGEKQALTTEQFIEKACKVHGNKYDYSKVNYINGHTPVTIICPIHGEFEQIPIKHLVGHGCRKCKGRDWTKEDFVKEANKIHNNYYNYDKCVFTGKTNKVIITCPIHGDFIQSPQIHIDLKCGCSKCSRSHGEEIIEGILKELEVNYKWQYKIKNPYKNSNFIVDFCIKNKNNSYSIIEFNGEQHYRPIKLWGGDIQFEKQIIRDNDLQKFCEENNVNLLEIKYNCSDIKSEIIKFL